MSVPVEPHAAMRATASETETPVTSERPTLSSPSALPPLRIKILIPGDKPASTALFNLATEGSQRFADPSPSGRQYVLRESSRDVVDTALRAHEVSHIEVVRPPRLGPISLPPIDGDTRPRNLNARITHNVPQFLTTFSTMTEHGATVQGAFFDEGAIRRTHVEFATDRVTLRTNQQLSEHSTHVGGTMAAKGIRPQALGMAKAMALLSFDWSDDLNQLDAVAETIQVSNHSYGPVAGWNWDERNAVWFWWGDPTLSQDEDAKFGKYTADNQQLDAILAHRPHLLAFVAAGNDRNDSPTAQPVDHFAMGRNPTTEVLEWQRSRRRRNRDGFDRGGLDTIAGASLTRIEPCAWHRPPR